MHRQWFEAGALAEIHKLYRCHDLIVAHKQALFATSTYFEASPPLPPGDKRRYGYSRDHPVMSPN